MRASLSRERWKIPGARLWLRWRDRRCGRRRRRLLDAERVHGREERRGCRVRRRARLKLLRRRGRRSQRLRIELWRRREQSLRGNVLWRRRQKRRHRGHSSSSFSFSVIDDHRGRWSTRLVRGKLNDRSWEKSRGGTRGEGWEVERPWGVWRLSDRRLSLAGVKAPPMVKPQRSPSLARVRPPPSSSPSQMPPRVPPAAHSWIAPSPLSEPRSARAPRPESGRPRQRRRRSRR
mmetsp:Transcript_18426/g.59950  ORF Transcript_18426/g.59950 Transcript_18426/m.59950 type:complete len:233 (-) Transcript_18426:77-775(-)